MAQVGPQPRETAAAADLVNAARESAVAAVVESANAMFPVAPAALVPALAPVRLSARVSQAPLHLLCLLLFQHVEQHCSHQGGQPHCFGSQGRVQTQQKGRSVAAVLVAAAVGCGRALEKRKRVVWFVRRRVAQMERCCCPCLREREGISGDTTAPGWSS